ncbi:MAG TPA: Gfo/Idh/MocA family oxidoreductase [Longimicrobiales bacterium]
MIRVAVAGLGKMGISHHAILNTHPDVQVVAACDSNSYVTDVLARHAGLRCFARYDEMLRDVALDAVVIATPSRLHGDMVEAALQRDLAVFCEKPFVLDWQHGEKLAELAESRGLVTQVGYHFRFVAAFEEAARVVAAGGLGRIHHVRAEAYGPVVLRQRGATWRSARSEGGGALYDYACHAIDLVNFVVGAPTGVSGVVMNRVFSRDVEDEIYCSLEFADGVSGQLAVNWSDESFRKMSTKISVWGSNGRLTADRQECQVYLRESHAALPDMGAGWTVRYTTDLTQPVWFYMRGEEYSAQLDYFVSSIKAGRLDGRNSFRSALVTDRVVAMVQEPGPSAARPVRPRGLIARVFR